MTLFQFQYKANMDKIIISNGSKNIVIGTKIAITEKDHEQGLMFKAWPPPIMSFPYDTLEVRSFWMHNTPSPLDIVFCKDNKVVGVFAGTPLSLEHLGPKLPINLVVEMPLGYARKLNINSNTKIELKYSLITLAKKYDYQLSALA